MPGSTTRTKSRVRDSAVFNSLQFETIGPVAAIGAAVTGATVQAQIILPCSAKIYGAMPTYTAIASILGTHFFNIVTGSGTYETTNGTIATQSLTVAGPVTGNVLTWSVAIPQSILLALGIQPIGFAGSPGIATVANGNVQFNFSYTVKSTDTTATILAASMIAYMTATLGFNAVLFANQAAGVITIGSFNTGTQYNSITTTGASSTGATTIAFGGATLAGGTATTGYTAVGTNDLFEYTGANVFAPPGTPVFASDMALVEPAPGTMTQGQNPYVPASYDVIYPQGTVLTLRAVTPASTGSITNLGVTLLLACFDVKPPQPTYNSFVPQLDIG